MVQAHPGFQQYYSVRALKCLAPKENPNGSSKPNDPRTFGSQILHFTTDIINHAWPLSPNCVSIPRNKHLYSWALLGL